MEEEPKHSCFDCEHSYTSYYERDTGYEERECGLIKDCKKCPLDYKKIERKRNNKMELKIELGNLAEEVKKVLEETSKELIKEQIVAIIKGETDSKLKEEITNQVNESLKNYINDYIANYKITIGNSLYDKEIKEYTIEEYLKMQLKDILEGKNITIIKKNSWGSDTKENISFVDYITKNISIESEIKNQLENQIKDIRDLINKKIKTTFDNSTKDILSSTLVNMLSANETYNKISNSIKIIANKE